MEKGTGASQPVAGGAASPRVGRGLETQLCTGLFPSNKFISGNDNNNMRTITGFGEKNMFCNETLGSRGVFPEDAVMLHPCLSGITTSTCRGFSHTRAGIPSPVVPCGTLWDAQVGDPAVLEHL